MLFNAWVSWIKPVSDEAKGVVPPKRGHTPEADTRGKPSYSLLSAVHRFFSTKSVRNATKHLLPGDQYLSFPVAATYRLKYLLMAEYALPIRNRPVKT